MRQLHDDGDGPGIDRETASMSQLPPVVAREAWRDACYALLNGMNRPRGAAGDMGGGGKLRRLVAHDCIVA